MDPHYSRYHRYIEVVGLDTRELKEERVFGSDITHSDSVYQVVLDLGVGSVAHSAGAKFWESDPLTVPSKRHLNIMNSFFRFAHVETYMKTSKYDRCRR